ncbi:MAG: adenosylhomocysteinase [Candidatus Omnitrophota bacterium]|nr:MAG: adenosylhomocysteinase [Candidatus Omnitrophota bacterium]
MKYDIKDIRLAEKGRLRIEWAKEYMPVLSMTEERFRKEKPFKGMRISGCLHITTETASLATCLAAGGARVLLCASNPLSTQDDVASSLVKHYKIAVFAKKGENRSTYYKHINKILDQKPNITVDDGADLVSTIHSARRDLLQDIIGGTEETTTGIIRLRNLEKKGKLMYPIVAVNDADTKHLFDNRYGTGQSTIDGIIRATNRLIAGSNFIACGYGWCGRGVAMRARGMGANVTVCEVDPLRALEAVMDGYKVAPLREAAKYGDIFVTATGDISILDGPHFASMKDGAIVANTGHFNVEINIKALKNLSKRVRKIRDFVEEYTLKSGKRINLLASGRLVNLAAAEGHPAHVMDMSFANQALGCLFLVQNRKKLDKRVYAVPEEIDKEIARLKLKSMGVGIDRLTPEQNKYLNSWEAGT